MAVFLLGLGGAVALLALATAVEFVSPLDRYTLRSRLRGFMLSLIYIAVGAAIIIAAQSLWLSLGIQPLVVLPVRGIVGDVTAVAAVIIAADFLAYWHHRALHRFFWPIHAVHHSQTELHAANSYGHLLEKVTQFLFIAIPLSLIPFDAPATPFVAVAIIQLLEYYIHSPTSAHFGPLRVVFVDNRYHRIHHSTEERHFDRNFGILLSVWDRVFGTAHDPQREEWPDTGVTGHPPPRSIIEYITFPARFWPRTSNPVSRRAM